jgi:hypothetical protein
LTWNDFGLISSSRDRLRFSKLQLGVRGAVLGGDDA